MAVDMFLKIADIEGESLDDKHKGEIEVLSFAWNIARAQRGRAKVADFSIVKNVDKATPKLFDAVCEGDRLGEANFTARKAGAAQFEFLKIKLSDVLISSVSPAGNNSNDRPMEQVVLSFSKSEISYIPQEATGKPGPPVTSSCSLRARSAAADHEE